VRNDGDDPVEMRICRSVPSRSSPVARFLTTISFLSLSVEMTSFCVLTSDTCIWPSTSSFVVTNRDFLLAITPPIVVRKTAVSKRIYTSSSFSKEGYDLALFHRKTTKLDAAVAPPATPPITQYFLYSLFPPRISVFTIFLTFSLAKLYLTWLPLLFLEGPLCPNLSACPDAARNI